MSWTIVDLYRGPVDRVFISLTESCDLHDYIDHYLRERGFVVNEATRRAIAQVLQRYRGPAPFLQVELDRFLGGALAK